MADAPRSRGPLLTLEALRKRYRPSGPWVLDGVTLTLRAGELLAVVGESGSGKSTLLNIVAGLDRADSGRVLFDAIDFSGLDDDALTRLRRARIGFIFQAFYVLPYLTALQNVALPLDLLQVPRAEREVRARQALERCGIGALADRYPRELSGGELQRIAVARALVHAPALVLADEPTGNLDAASAAQVLALLRERLAAGNTAAILITHSAAAARMADRIVQLENGHLLDQAP